MRIAKRIGGQVLFTGTSLNELLGSLSEFPALLPALILRMLLACAYQQDSDQTLAESEMRLPAKASHVQTTVNPSAAYAPALARILRISSLAKVILVLSVFSSRTGFPSTKSK